jgi:hypothetical protein
MASISTLVCLKSIVQNVESSSRDEIATVAWWPKPNIAQKRVPFLLRTQKIPSSNFILETGYSDEGLL